MFFSFPLDEDQCLLSMKRENNLPMVYIASKLLGVRKQSET